MPQHIGIIAVSPEGSAVCYRLLAQRASAVPDAQDRPLITMHSIPFSRYLDAIGHDDWERVAQLLQWSCETLVAAGAQLCILPDNLAHHAAPMARTESPIPWVSMIELVADAVVADGRKTVGLIGARALTGGSIYQTILGLRGVKVVVPEQDDIAAINTIIFDELIHGSVTEPSRQLVERVLDQFAQRGCEGVILGSTETPLLISDKASGLALYDPVRLLVAGTMDIALGRARADH